MDQLETLLPLSSQTPTSTATVRSPLNPTKPPPDPASLSSPNIGTPVYANTPCSDHPPIPLRLATILALFLLSLWANYEASKGFDLTILNAPTHTLASRRFNLLFVSNGRAAGMALKSSSFIERFLYPKGEGLPRKHVRHVTVCLADHNITNDVHVLVSRQNTRGPVPSGNYLIEISLSVMVGKDAIKTAVALALHRGMAYVWLWDGHGSVPRPIIDAVVEYLLVQYNLPSKNYESTQKKFTIASIIQQCQERSNDFIVRLNNAMREKWNEYAVTDAFSSPSEITCLSQIISAFQQDGILPDVAGFRMELKQAM
jgi:Peptidase of plants and bacteria